MVEDSLPGKKSGLVEERGVIKILTLFQKQSLSNRSLSALIAMMQEGVLRAEPKVSVERSHKSF